MNSKTLEEWSARHAEWERKTTHFIEVWINEGERLFVEAGDERIAARRKAVDFMVDGAHKRFREQKRLERRAAREKR